MTPYNAQWEAQIQGLRKNRRLLVARNIPFEATQAAFEADARARLTKPDSATFLWPPSSGRYDDPARHMGWVMLAFKERSDARMAEMDLKDYKFRDCQVRIGRASKIAHPPRSSQEAAPAIVPVWKDALLSRFSHLSRAVDGPSRPSYLDASTQTEVSSQIASVHDTDVRNSFSSPWETPVLSQDALAWLRNEAPRDKESAGTT